jgi:hypothetical protein
VKPSSELIKLNPSAPHWADQLFRLYPSLAANAITPEFVEGVRGVLALYPEKVLAVVCDPVHGIATKTKFFPSLAELREELDRVHEPDLNIARVERQVRDLVEERSREEQIKEDRKNRPTYEELMEGVPDSLRMHPKPKKMTADEFIAKHPHVTKEMLNSIPDAPQRLTGPSDDQVEWTQKAPQWDEVVAFYKAHPGRIVQLANAHKKLRMEEE